MIEVQDVWFGYEGRDVLKGVSFKFDGGVMAIVGPNGSGKTTLVKHLNGLLKPRKGKVIVDGLDTREHTVAELSRIVGYVFQNPETMFFEESVYREVAFGPKNLGLDDDEVERNVQWALEMVGLSGYEDRSPFSLSGGEKQRLAIACILAMRPKYLVLDEPTTGLDGRAVRGLVKVIKGLVEEGHGVILVTHDMELVLELADRVMLLREGRVTFDGPVDEFFSLDLESLGLEKPELLKIAEEAGIGFVRTVDDVARLIT
ncbi:energy-coupling factor ABC transporter ATP-binding protein [Pyrococcus yayanosii]|uniref:Cobalt ABC transporter, ATP-binding protein n=1 Tax=Pyrococcus yayanosii (strain CH1 / JCM 16557) TaxID=529709 RepID=F8AH46_PYRYC|nr:ABC transporter ATP-binding protein [Pyrococcus yayanosii]AEH25276.1 cobalt ABC transporter, ATP-binding protein [Pyrococcus yayanosii CH1]